MRSQVFKFFFVMTALVDTELAQRVPISETTWNEFPQLPNEK